MNTLEKKFHTDSRDKVFDENHKRKMTHALKQAQKSLRNGKEQFRDLTQAKELARIIKEEAIANLDTYLLEFEEKFTRNGGKVIWAKDGEEALEAVWEICKDKNVEKIVKSKSMVTEDCLLYTSPSPRD